MQKLVDRDVGFIYTPIRSWTVNSSIKNAEETINTVGSAISSTAEKINNSIEETISNTTNSIENFLGNVFGGGA